MPMPATRSRTKSDHSSLSKKKAAEIKSIEEHDDSDDDKDILSTPRTRSMTRSHAGISTPTEAVKQTQRKSNVSTVKRGRKPKETSETLKSEGDDKTDSSPGDPRSPSSSRSPTRKKESKAKGKKSGGFIGVEITGNPFFNPKVDPPAHEEKRDETKKDDNTLRVPAKRNVSKAFNKTIFSHNIATFLSIPLLFCLFVCMFEHSSWGKPIQDTFITSLCIIPGVSHKPFCYSKPPSAWADFAGLMDLQARSFENIAKEWVGGSTSPLEMKATEIATKDLVTLVKTSELGVKVALANSLRNLATDTKWGGRALQKLHSNIKGTFDKIVAMNDYAARAIEGATGQDKANNFMGWPIFRTQDPDTVILQVFEKTMNKFSDTTKSLLNDAEKSLRNLNRLEERLNAVYEVALENNMPISSANKDRLLGELWTIFARNKNAWRNSDEDRLVILRGFKDMKERIINRTIGVSNTLLAMNKALDELRERTTMLNPKSVENFDEHVQSLKKGIERMRYIQNAAKMSEEVGLNNVLSRYGSSDSDEA